MIFCPAEDVGNLWRLIATNTANNELGIAAKVATYNTDQQEGRLICIYTNDFNDVDDVVRVLDKLKSLGAVQPTTRPIYYKCGPYLSSNLSISGRY